MTIQKNSDYDVGYGKPPEHSKFRKGHSGNKRGRPQGARGFKTDLLDELRETVPLTQNGKQTFYSKQRLIVKALTAKAIKGDVGASLRIIDLGLKLFPEQEESDAVPLSESDQAILAEFLARHG